MIKKTIVLSILLCFSLLAIAQNLSKSDVGSIKIRNSGPIIQDDQVKGYYNFYNLEKKDRKNNNYLLNVLDENLKEINSVTIVRPSSYMLIEGAFNGTAFGFLFYDTKEKAVELVSYDKTLKETGKVKKELTNKYASIPYIWIQQGHEQQQPFLLSVPNKGFLYYGIQNESKSEYEIEFYNNSMKRTWVSYAPKDKYDFENAGEAYQGEEYVGSLIVKRTALFSLDMDFDLLVQNVADGKTLFRIPMETPKFKFSLTEVFYDKAKQQFILFGEYFTKDQNEIKSPSVGFATVVLDMKGKIISEKESAWKTDIANMVAAKDKDKFDETSIMFHDFVRTDDGQFFAIGEQYKKGGIPMVSPKLSIFNMVIFQFDADFNIKKVNVFEKDKKSISLPSNMLIFSSKLLAYLVKAMNGFDYVFSQTAPDKKTFITTYINYDKEKGQKSKYVLGAIVYTPEKTFSVDKLPLATKSTLSYVYRAKQGYVLVVDYFEKDKRSESHLEKINY
ncbi:MAG: hypothetical protein QM734_05060 [Cyclobacteriaceae bacterium]